ncbi:Nucleoporin nup84 [Agyrium rufum]|nr:Nucleoporin nup84 [Agyrium rufum]
MGDKRFPGEMSWDSIRPSEASDSNPDDESYNGRNDSAEPFGGTRALETVNEVKQALHPLQDTADRVGKQVEQFAEQLDRLGEKLYKKTQRDCRHVIPLIAEYERIADETVEALRRTYQPERAERRLIKEMSLRVRSNEKGRPRSRGSHTSRDRGMNSTIEDLHWWERERQTWNLLRRMVEIEYPAAATSSGDSHSISTQRPKKMQHLNRYSTEQERYLQFLAEDDMAWERHSVVAWLKMCCDDSNPEFDSVIEQAENDADRGSGLSMHGWLNSLEAIKAQKRTRTWPKPMDPNMPGVDYSMYSKWNGRNCVTQADPDAALRQGRNLQEEDQAFEKFAWMACWEMLRRGQNWSAMHEWFAERSELWRAIVLRGDSRDTPKLDNSKEMPPSVAWQCGSLWRMCCAAASKDGGLNDYERAVYGLLGGYLPGVLKVCKTWDEHLLAHYNSYLIYQFEGHLRSSTVASSNAPISNKKLDLQDVLLGGASILPANKIMDRIKDQDNLEGGELRLLRTIQGDLIEKQFTQMVHQFGSQLSGKGNEDILLNASQADDEMKNDSDESHPRYGGIEDQYNVIRLLTHFIIIFQALGAFDEQSPAQRDSTENILCLYIEFLASAGKQDLLPLYASRISKKKACVALGKQLPLIQDDEERRTMLSLMRGYGMKIIGVLTAPYEDAALFASSIPGPGEKSTKHITTKLSPTHKLQLLETDPGKTLFPWLQKFPTLKANPVSGNITQLQSDLIGNLEWFLLLDGYWDLILTQGTMLYRWFFAEGSFEAGRYLASVMPFSRISLSKTRAILGEELDLSHPDAFDLPANGINGHGEEDPYRQQPKADILLAREILYTRAAAFRDLEALFVTLDVFERWSDLAYQRPTNPGGDKMGWKQWSSKMKRMHEELEAIILVILAPEWLTSPNATKDEAKLNLETRVSVLPEILLAYLSAINFIGHYITREAYIKAMDLATIVANETHGRNLVEALTKSGRMAEFVHALTVVCQELLGSVENGDRKGERKRRKEDVERQMRIWCVDVGKGDGEKNGEERFVRRSKLK